VPKSFIFFDPTFSLAKAKSVSQQNLAKAKTVSQQSENLKVTKIVNLTKIQNRKSRAHKSLLNLN